MVKQWKMLEIELILYYLIQKKKILRYNYKHTYKHATIFDENLVGIHMLKGEVKLNKPIYIGQNVLDDSKVLIGDFHYNFMIEKIGYANLNLLFTDTDSLCYEIRNNNIYEIIKDNKQYFDLSDYSKDNPLYDTTNKKKIGCFKDESNGKIISEFCGVRSKCYSYTIDVKHTNIRN